MSFAFMPVYTGDYHRDTRHLTPEEHGIYMLLLMHCWDQKGPVPLDERRQCGLVNARSGGEIESLRRVLLEFFTRMDDGWYNKRMTEEISRAEGISAHRRAGALEKARRQRDAVRHAQAVLKQSTSIASAGTPTPTPTLTPTPTKAKSFGAETSGGAAPKAPARKLAATRVRLDGPSEEHRAIAVSRGVDCDFEFMRYRDWQAATGKPHKDEVAGFRNWLRGAKASRVEVVARQIDTMDKITGRAVRGPSTRPVGAEAVRALRGDVREQDEDDVGHR